jgi:hypothetical protein
MGLGIVSLKNLKVVMTPNLVATSGAGQFWKATTIGIKNKEDMLNKNISNINGDLLDDRGTLLSDALGIVFNNSFFSPIKDMIETIIDTNNQSINCKGLSGKVSTCFSLSDHQTFNFGLKDRNDDDHLDEQEYQENEGGFLAFQSEQVNWKDWDKEAGTSAVGPNGTANQEGFYVVMHPGTLSLNLKDMAGIQRGVGAPDNVVNGSVFYDADTTQIKYQPYKR